MHVGIAVVGLVGIRGSIVGVHVVRHGAAVDQEIGRMIIFGRHRTHVGGTSDAGGRNALGDGLGLGVDLGIHFGELEQVFPVVAGFPIVVSGSREPGIGLGVREIRR